MQKSDVERRKTSLKQHHMSSETKISLDKKEESCIPTESISEREEGSSLNLPNSDHVKSGPNYPVPPSISREELNSSSPMRSTKEGSKENMVLDRFLTQNIEKHSILAAFCDCWPIVNVEEVSLTKQSMFKDFVVHFEVSSLILFRNSLLPLQEEKKIEKVLSAFLLLYFLFYHIYQYKCPGHQEKCKS